MKMDNAETAVRYVLLDAIASNTLMAGRLGTWVDPEKVVDALMKAMLESSTRWAFMTYVNQEQEER